MGRGWAGLAAVTAIVVGATACSSSDAATVDAPKLERDIRAQLEQSNRVQRVDCPDDVKIEAGARFTCTATIEGTRRIIDVRLTGKQQVVFAVRG